MPVMTSFKLTPLHGSLAPVTFWLNSSSKMMSATFLNHLLPNGGYDIFQANSSTWIICSSPKYKKKGNSSGFPLAKLYASICNYMHNSVTLHCTTPMFMFQQPTNATSFLDCYFPKNQSLLLYLEIDDGGESPVPSQR